MKFKNEFNKITTDENLMETIPHGSSRYPFRYYAENLALFDFHCIEWHWHTELEFVYIQSGNVCCQIGDVQFDLSAGNGLFINSKILHRLYSATDALIPNFVCMPSFIAPADSLIYQKYVSPIISSALTYQIFRETVPWQNTILTYMQQIFTAQDTDTSRELMTSALMQRLWLNLFENAALPDPAILPTRSSAAQARLQIMMQFIHQNYTENLSLDDIAHHAMISKSTALNLFRKYLNTTPVNYLIGYRLKQAALLLAKTEQKIHTIAAMTGFNHMDYFCRLFKRYYGQTPTEYRNYRNEH